MPPAGKRQQPGLRERKKAKTRRSIQAHALRLFKAQGYDATTIEQIIAAAEVSETTFFRYFPTKEDVVLTDNLDPVLLDAFRSQPPDLPVMRALRNAFKTAFATLSAGEHLEMRERITLVNEVPALRARMLDQFRGAVQLLSEAVAERAHRAPDDFAVRTLVGAMIGVGMVVPETLAKDPQADIAALMDEAIAQLEVGLTL